ncbi:solute carrier organic anion transporter family member 2A1-like [Lytechinus pictus]|uniref:solute carrier organic anion transporter family member 2A1-like n=1 Tax=Lytechinus pictus TaxID=7653 RepID=UPI0030BA166C
MTDYSTNNNNRGNKTGSRRQDVLKDPDRIPPEDILCCCPPTCAPSWLQGLANPKVFTFHMMVITSFAMMSYVYIGAVLTTIERNFQLDSAQSGAITIAADIVSTLFVIPLSHYGQMGHRPRWIGTGMLVTAVGTMICSFPHFLTDPIDPKVILTGSVDAVEDLCSAGDEGLNVYEASQSWSNASDGHYGVHPEERSSKGDLRSVWWIIFGQIISGIGNAPFVALVITYIDDSVKKHNITAYTAVLFMAFTFGPSCGFLFAAFTTRLYVDFDRVPSDQIPQISQNDPRWIGAWWLGFVILSIILVILSIPIFFYPRTLPSAVKKWKEEKKEAEAGEENQLNRTSITVDDEGEEEDNDLRERSGSIYAHLDGGNAVETVIKGPLLAMKRLVCNPTNMCLVVDETAFISLIAIFAAFGVKYTETQFSLSPSEAALVTAIVLGPSSIFSNIFSAYICRRFKFNSKQCGLFVLVCATLGFILYPMGMLLGCDNVPTAGVTHSYDGVPTHPDDSSISNGCNMHCACSDEVFQPVCGSNGLTYISPCHAGCTKELTLDFNGTTAMPNPFTNEYNYSACSCISNSSLTNNSATNLFGSPTSHSVDASAGKCPDPTCQGAIPISILLSAIFFLQSASSNPMTYIALRCVREEDRSMAIALRSVSAHFLGFFPAPIYFGAIINSVCIHWQITDGDRGSCWEYDNGSYRMAYFGSAMALQGVALISIICMYFSIKEKLRNKKVKNDGRYDNLEKKERMAIVD